MFGCVTASLHGRVKGWRGGWREEEDVSPAGSSAELPRSQAPSHPMPGAEAAIASRVGGSLICAENPWRLLASPLSGRRGKQLGRRLEAAMGVRVSLLLFLSILPRLQSPVTSLKGRACFLISKREDTHATMPPPDATEASGSMEPDTGGRRSGGNSTAARPPLASPLSRESFESRSISFLLTSPAQAGRSVIMHSRRSRVEQDWEKPVALPRAAGGSSRQGPDGILCVLPGAQLAEAPALLGAPLRSSPPP